VGFTLLHLFGVARGGSVDITVDGVSITVVANEGDSAEQVLANLAAAINGDATLQSLGTTSSASDRTSAQRSRTFATRGPFPSVMQRKGYDYRTSMGLGEIQLVSPLLTMCRVPIANTETTSVGILKLVFVPEPSRSLLLAAGLGCLGVLHRVRGWRRRTRV
jgi:hypothetical protein